MRRYVFELMHNDGKSKASLRLEAQSLSQAWQEALDRAQIYLSELKSITLIDSIELPANWMAEDES